MLTPNLPSKKKKNYKKVNNRNIPHHLRECGAPNSARDFHNKCDRGNSHAISENIKICASQSKALSVPFTLMNLVPFGGFFHNFKKSNSKFEILKG